MVLLLSAKVESDQLNPVLIIVDEKGKKYLPASSWSMSNKELD
jgi:hypothetical protein